MERKWSEQQARIFHWFETSEVPQSATVGQYVYDGVVVPTVKVKNLVVVARAGSGKTTTALKAVELAPENRIIMTAFNKSIADELTGRLPQGKAEAKTLHSIGFACVRRFKDGLKLEGRDNAGVRKSLLADKVCSNAPDKIKALVAKLHTHGREIVPHATQYEDLIEIAERFQCESPDEWANTNFDTKYIVEKALEAMELAATVNRGDWIDFTDMIFLPVRNGWLVPMFDMVVVDEAQDMTVAQLELAQGVCRKDGRMCVIGDNMQAIYGFRGADSESLGRLKLEMNAAELGLTTTYRCGKKIVALAQELVPDFQAGEDNPDGEVIDLAGRHLVECVAPGDFVLSRLNAPLVSAAMQMLRAGVRARIKGRDIGSGLIALVNKLAKGRAANSVPEFLARVDSWQEAETLRYRAAKKEAKVEEVADKANMLIELADGAKSVREITDRIQSLFTDDGLGQRGVVTCSSVHRSKGLEADNVFVLADTLRNHNQEELNIRYVAYTRAINRLVLVKGDLRA
jgi:superfamily I DNA/RNA helicase